MCLILLCLQFFMLTVTQLSPSWYTIAMQVFYIFSCYHCSSLYVFLIMFSNYLFDTGGFCDTPSVLCYFWTELHPTCAVPLAPCTCYPWYLLLLFPPVSLFLCHVAFVPLSPIASVTSYCLFPSLLPSSPIFPSLMIIVLLSVIISPILLNGARKIVVDPVILVICGIP